MAELVESNPASALAIYAHPDDPEVSCGGTLARWAAAGGVVHVVICCRGDKGSLDVTVDSVGLAERRAGEVAAASAADARAARVIALQLRDDALDRTARRELHDDEGDQHDPEQRRDHEQDATRDIA
ncbi:MAG TPA: PIG-L family deacetylase [Acidimicrobiales bacterium]|nr:PIG-L family deacetylase [Acidimicrobiales bacterium]